MSFLNRLNPTPAFPAYTGPYKVGSVDVEIPTSELESPGPSPSPCTNLPTVAFRIFYPCRQGSEQRGVRWIPSPQREVVGAYARFLGAGSAFASMFSLVPQLLYYINIPVHNNADVLEPTTNNGRWPVVMFSHGLGGSRNAYSHICGSLASHGLVVVAPDHRDGSAPISFMHSPDEKGKLRRVEYTRIAHTPSPEVYEARDEQLRVRLWELGLIHDALLKIDQRVQLTNVAEDQKRNGGKDMLTMFSHTLNVHEPGAITFAGHSFGAATTVQFLKSVYYRPKKDLTDFRPLFTPSPVSNIVKQITPETPTILLDLWCLPLQSPSTAYLKSKPLPCYDSPTGGSNLLAILSEAFFKWTVHLKETKRLIAKPSPSSSKYPSQPGPNFFYPVSSAHLSQSDFGVLFQWATTKIFGAKEPERVLRLNTRAILQVLRNAGIEVAKTSFSDLEMGEKDVGGSADTTERGLSQDTKILSRTRESVRGWICLGTEVGGESEERVEGGPEDAVVEGEVLGEVVDRKERQHL